MADELTTLRAVLDDIARRRAALAWRRGWVMGALMAATALAAVRLAIWAVAPTGASFLLLIALGLIVAVAALVVALRAARLATTPVQVARLLEERLGGLDDVVVTAVDYASRDGHAVPAANRLATAALAAVGAGGADAVVAGTALQAAGRRAVAAGLALAAALVFMAGPLRDAVEVAGAYVWPSRLAIVVEPGDVRVRAGRAVTIRARLSGNAALAPMFVAGTGGDVVPQPMRATSDGAFEIVVPDVSATFPYHVAAGAGRSAAYTVTVVHPARVERIDLEYAYPPALGLEPRREDDGGDIYAPEGTAVTLRITADRPVGASALMLGDGTRLALGVNGALATGLLTVSADSSYRIAFVDDDGIEMPDDTEYFIRTLLDRPPDVRVVRPAGDKQVSPLEEVLIEARADDDFGVRSFELVMQKPGDQEVVVPLAGNAAGLTVNGAHTLYLEDLEVAPGDIVSYYVRARDIGRGKPSSESRSDMYFLEVKAFNDEFVAAQSQAMAAGGQAQGVQDLAAAQKEIVVATWKLDSRGKRANRESSARDIAAIADAQRALEQRAAKEAGNQLQAAGDSAGGSPRRRRGRATLNGVSEDPMGLAIEAMRRATVELDKRQTTRAMPHEMEALNQLLRAESEVQRRQIARQQAGGGGGGNRETPDLSALFDQELRKQQQTNYETPASSETREDTPKEADPLERLRELARRQEALSREQQDLARSQQGLDAEALKRRLERLTRDQEELRRQLEQLAREMPRSQGQQAGAQPQESQSPQGQQQASQQQQGQQGQQGQKGQQGQQGQGQPSQGQQSQPSAQGQQSGQPGDRGQSAGGQPQNEQQAVRDALQEMQQASSGLREQDAARASASAGRALERMRRAEDAMRGSTADDMRRRLGDVQLEARQLADAQRRLSEELARAGQAGDASAAAGARQAAAEQERLAGRADRLRQGMRDLAQQARGNDARGSLDQAGREMEAGRTAELMRDAAKALGPEGRGASGAPAAPERPGAEPAGAAGSTSTRPTPGGASPRQAAEQAARLGADAARALDKVAERLDGRRTGDAAAGSRLSDDLSKTRQLREQLDSVERSLEQLRAQEGRAGQPQGEGRDGRQPGTPRDARDGRASDGEIARLQQQLADEMRQARAQVDALGRGAPDMRGPSTPEAWQPSVSAPGTEAFKQDFARWESLKRSLLLALEKVERGLTDELRQQASRDRLNAGASDAVPDDYRRLVDKYYRSLATPRRPER
ncbi:MAG: hypothetical protein KA151_10625 [Piscinibacter sp.]|nr:hypothetical protein [Piscinibacter sp.]